MFELHLHPFLSSFPAVLLTLSVLAEMITGLDSRRDFGSYVSFHLYLAVALILAAFLSGYIAAPHAQSVLGRGEDEISYHHIWGKAVLIVAIVTMSLRWIAVRARFHRPVFVALFRSVLLLLWLLTIVTGYLGGSMLLSGVS